MKATVCVPKNYKDKAFLVELLRQWVILLETYEAVGCQNCDDTDAAYWYGERTLTGLLGAAAWSLGGWSVEEFTTDRHKGRRKSKSGKGRGDLWFGKASFRATVEAKLHWINKSITDAEERLWKCHRKAKNQLRQIDGECRVGIPFSACYVVPWYVAKRNGLKKGTVALKALQEGAKAAGAATALHFGCDAVKKWQDDGRAYPGVLLVLRQESW
ncbi:MAG: hypothetical protein U1A77_24065 [Pirellulales bacterium]